jgi:hypothetical protein
MHEQATSQARSEVLLGGAYKQESGVGMTRTGKHVVAQFSEFS